MTISEKIKIENQEVEIIKTDNWELPVSNLGNGKFMWRPKTSCLPYSLFQGPHIARREKGLSLTLDLAIAIHGSRGACKTLLQSYLLAKKMRMGEPVWANWPISFYVIEKDCWDACTIPINECLSGACLHCKKGVKTYYENYPLDFDKLYTFQLTEGATGITEMTYYADPRTSGRAQNRIIGYQLMQMRKDCRSFYYDAQFENWVDNRFGRSDDIQIFCSDIAKMSYKGPDIDFGAYAQLMFRDISGIMTGHRYMDDGMEFGPYQFFGQPFWHIYPTHWKVDIFEAVNSYKQQNDKQDKAAKIGNAVNQALIELLEAKQLEVQGNEIWENASRIAGFDIPASVGGKVLSVYNIPKHQKANGKYYYDLSELEINYFSEQDGKKEDGK